MTTDTKIFVGLPPIGKGSTKAKREPPGPACQWDDCGKAGSHRAPVGRDGEGLYLLFCSEHASQYNKGYDFSPELSEPEVARYQREAASGSRRAHGARVSHASEAPLPSTKPSGSAKAINARTRGAQAAAPNASLQRRGLRVLEAKAFDTLGLSPDATAEDIRRRYKERLKMHHPDANDGDRGAEDQLKASIEAHRILKLNGFC
jgi:curved DNA-binding protein CbpA